MVKGKKTIEVSVIKEEINRLLALETIPEETKKTLCTFIERVLMDTKNYKGFNYVKWWSEGGFKEWQSAGSPDFPEKQKYMGPEYRRIYF